jgi:hypothetical protein
MGSKYVLSIQIISQTHSFMIHHISFVQFVVEDELYKCLPFIEHSRD